VSAWIVERGHIDVLVAAALQYRVIEAKLAGPTGADLWRENHASVNYRYDEATVTPSYRRAVRAVEPLHPVAVLKAIDCYDYQSCEHQGWGASRAAQFCTLLRLAVLAEHPELAAPVQSRHYHEPHMTNAYTEHPVYDKAPWGFDVLAQAYRANYDETVERDTP